MKLRLPHKFQAALMAAIASVSLTTLSSGTACGAVTLADTSSWVQYDENTGTATVGNTDTGLQYGTIHEGGQDWNTTWAYVVTVDTASLLDSAKPESILIVGLSQNQGAAKYAEAATLTCSGGTPQITLTTWSHANVKTEQLSATDCKDLTFVVTRPSNGQLTLDVYKDGDFGTKLFTATETTGQIFGSAVVASAGTGSSRGDAKGGNTTLPADDTVGSYTVLGAGYSLGSVASSQDLQTYYNNITVLQWNGTGNNDWSSTAANWLKWGEGDAMAFTVTGAQALFGKGDGLSKVVNVTGDSAVSVSAVKVLDDYTFNMTGSLNAGKITIAKGASLAYTGSGSLSGALSGAGTYILPSGTAALGNVTIGGDWTGAVRLSGQMANLNINTLGNNIASTIEFAGVAGNQTYFADHGGNIQSLSRDVIFTDANNTSALRLNDGFSRNGAYEFAGNVSGHGTFELDKAGVTYHFIFSGDVSGWDGQFKVTHSSDGASTGRTWVKFAGDAQEVNATINNVGGFLRVIADTDAAFSKAITASEFEVTAGHTATLGANATVGGLTGAGNVVSSGKVSLNGTADFTMDGALTASVLERTNTNTATGTQTFNGLVTVTGAARTEVYKGGFNFAGGYKYTGGNTYAIVTSGGTTVHFGGESDMGGKLVGNGGSSTIAVDAGATLTAKGFWGTTTSSSGNGAVNIAAGATVTTTDNFNTSNLSNAGSLNVGGQLWATTLSGSGTLTITNDLKYDGKTDGSYSGSINAKNITKEGTGKLTLSGVNTFTNATALNAGTLEVAQVASLGGQGVTTGANTSLIFNTAADGIYGGSITGSGSVTKSGEGTLELSGANTYTGDTAVNQGTLALGSSLATTGDITVASGAGITFANGATIAANSLGLNSGATLDFSDYKGTVGSKVNVVTTTTGVTGFNDAAITGPTAPRGMQASVEQEDNNIVLTFQAKEDATMHLYILTGQSNSLGAVKGRPMSAGMIAAYQSEALLWNGNMHKERPSGADTNRYVADPDWQIVAPQEPGLTLDASAYSGNPCMGPEYGFSYILENKEWASQLLGADDTLAVVKGSLDGGGNHYWLPENNAYQTLLDNVKLSIQDAVTLGYTKISLDGLMYLQGESDSADETAIADTRFAAFLTNLTNDLNTWLATEDAPKGVEVTFEDNAVTGENFSNATTSQKFLDAATKDGKVNADDNGRGFVFTKDLANIGDNLHYRGTSQLTIGARYAYAFAVQNGVNVGAVRGQDDSKTLDQAGAWWMEVLPSSDAVATWDISSVSTVNNIANGKTLTVGGIRIEEVYCDEATAKGQGSVAINGGTISLGASGINLVGGDLSITSGVTVRESQAWQAADGHKLAVNGTTYIEDGATLTMADGLYLTFGAITGTGSLEIGTVTFDMNLDYMMANGLGRYMTSEGAGDNGFFTGRLDLVRLTGTNSTITFTGAGGSIDNITRAGELASHTLALSDDGKALQLTDLAPDEETYFTRKGEVTYTSSDTGDYGIYNARQVMLSGTEENPATLVLASELKEGATIQASGLGGTVNIVDGVTLAATSVNAAGGAVTITGSGKLVGKTSGTVGSVTAVDAFGAGVTLSDEWTGTVRIADTTINAGQTGIKLNELGNANSVVEFEGVKAFLNADSYIYTPNIMLTGDGLNIDAGTTDGTYTFNGDVTGSGTLKLSLSRGSNGHTYVFAGDVAGWNGELMAPTNGKTLTVKFTGNADTVNAAITRTGGTLNLAAEVDTTFNKGVAADKLTVTSHTANLNGGADTDYSLGVIDLSNGTMAIGEQGVKSLSVNDVIVRGGNSALTSNTEAPYGFNAQRLDVSNFSTNFTLQNVTLNVSGAATAGVLNTAQTNDQATVTVGDNAALNLNGSVVWRKPDTQHSGKTDTVDLTINSGGAVSVTGGTENVLNNVTLNQGGTLTFGAGTATTIAGAVVLANTITNDGAVTLTGSVNLDALTAIYDQEGYVDGQRFGNGFFTIEAQVRVFTENHVGTITSTAATATYKGVQGTIGTDGLFNTLDNKDLTTFYVKKEGSSENYSTAYGIAGTSLTTVSLDDDTTVNMNEANATLGHLVLTEGASATVQVSENATISSVEGVGAAQTLSVTGTAGKALTLNANNTMTGTVDVQSGTLKTTAATALGNAHVDVAAGGTLELGANLTLAAGMDNAGTISMEGKNLTLNGQEGRTAYNLGTITGNDGTNLYVNGNADAVFTGNASMHHLESAANSTVTVAETATLTLTNTADRGKAGNYNTFYGLDNQGTISIKGSNGDMRFYGTSNDQVFNLGHLHIDGASGTSYLLTAGEVNHTTDIAVKTLSGGGASHTLQATTCYNGAGTGRVVDLILGEAQDHSNLYTGTIQYGVGTGSAKAGSNMNVVLRDELVASQAVLQAIFSGTIAQHATITVDTAHAKVKGLTGTATDIRTMQVSGTEAAENRVIEIVGEGSYSYGGKLGANLDVVHSGTGTQSFAGADGFDGAIDVEAGTLNIMNIAQATSLSVQDVTISNSTLGVYTNATAAEANEGTLTIKDGHTLTASGADAKLNANLVMESGSTLDVSAYGGTGGLHMGSSITLNPGMFLSDKDMEGVSGLGFMDAYDLKYGVDEFFIGSTKYSEITFASETWVKASEVFSNDGFKDGKDYYVFYSGANPGGNGGNVGTIYIVQVPEPTTGTLSLLAFCALAARRRRKG